MSFAVIHNILQWSALINIVLLLYWFLMIVFAHDFVYRLHRRWFAVSVEQFDAIHYSGMLAFKMVVLVFNIAPLIAMYIVR